MQVRLWGAWAAPAILPHTELRVHEYLHSNVQLLTWASPGFTQLSDGLLAQTAPFDGSPISPSYLSDRALAVAQAR